MNKNIRPEFEELCTAYVLRALPEEDEQRFKAMLSDCSPEEEAFFRKMEETSAALAGAAEPVTPDPLIKERIMSGIQGRPEKPTTDRRSYFYYSAAAAVIFVFLSLGLLFYSQQLKKQVDQQDGLITQQQVRIEVLSSELQRREELLAILESREVDLVVMSGQEVNPQGYGKVVWDKERGQALLQIANLPLIDAQNDYQLWFIRDGQPVSAGIFGVRDTTRDNFFKIEDLKESADQGAFAITLEPQGGSPQPTGDMYLLGELGS